jgi:hypothetical protein
LSTLKRDERVSRLQSVASKGELVSKFIKDQKEQTLGKKDLKISEIKKEMKSSQK